ncbi:unnamed protein product [Lactuca virosa]|uniref:Uncharacterized protein n=1 Tax=Lactuca virosa TaxID=75947 RepID=A0AAU9N6H1_9ASTR|nr:unnamed protein product [Lactuca virosa]
MIGCRRMLRTKHYCIIWSLKIIPRHLSKLEILKHNGKGPESIIHYKEAEGFFWININIQEAHLTDHLSNVDCWWSSPWQQISLNGYQKWRVPSQHGRKREENERICILIELPRG